MIESRLHPAVDGSGGGYGRYPGLTTVEIAERFRFLVEEGQGRSARAILRLVHEQTEARGRLNTQWLMVGIGATITVVLALFRLVAALETRDGLLRLALVAASITLLFAVGAGSMHRTTRRAEAQVREIRRMALLALDLLTTREGFVSKTLEREHLASLNDLRRSDPEAWTRVFQALT